MLGAWWRLNLEAPQKRGCSITPLPHLIAMRLLTAANTKIKLEK